MLGAVQAFIGAEAVDLGTRKQRALVTALALGGGRPVSVDSIVDTLWPEGAPPGVSGTLQAYVAGLRRALEPDRAARAPSTVLVTVAPGYALRVAEDDLDVARFDRAVSRAHRTIGQHVRLHETSGLTHDELSALVHDLDAALGSGAAPPTSSSRTPRPRWPSGPGSRSCGSWDSRTGPWPPSSWATTPRSPASSRRSPRHTRCASGSGGCAPSR